MVTLTVHSDTGEELVTLGLEPQAMLGDRCTNQVFPFAVSTGIYCIYHIKSTYTVVGYIYIPYKSGYIPYTYIYTYIYTFYCRVYHISSGGTGTLPPINGRFFRWQSVFGTAQVGDCVVAMWSVKRGNLVWYKLWFGIEFPNFNVLHAELTFQTCWWWIELDIRNKELLHQQKVVSYICCTCMYIRLCITHIVYISSGNWRLCYGKIAVFTSKPSGQWPIFS